MEETIARRLLELNREFYQTFAAPFSATRQRIQPGVRRVLESLPPDASVLDLGCGNGELQRELARRQHRGLYVGLDFSPALLHEAAARLPAGALARFLPADLSDPDWDQALRRDSVLGPQPSFDRILAFAALHHLPGDALRRQALLQARRLLSPNGRFIHSEWQFLNSPRLLQRILPWERLGLLPSDVDQGDYLLDWRSGGSGLRYVHHFDEAGLASLAALTGFTIREIFYSDGEGGRLGLYQVWEIDPHSSAEALR